MSPTGHLREAAVAANPRSAGAACGRRSIWTEFALGSGEADLEPFGLAEPAFAFGFGDACREVVTDLSEAEG